MQSILLSLFLFVGSFTPLGLQSLGSLELQSLRELEEQETGAILEELAKRHRRSLKSNFSKLIEQEWKVVAEQERRMTERYFRLSGGRRREPHRRPRHTCKCCIQSLLISFKEIGWDWIVQPEEFDAFYCRGKCRDVSSNFASTHALIQSILKYKGRRVTRPSCVPRKLRHLDLLHYDDRDPPQLVISRHKGMIVKDCACA